MSEAANSNGRVGWREYLDMRFDALEARLAERDKARDKREEEICSRADDHEDRIRAVEKQSPWRTLAEVITGALAVIGIVTGSKP